MPQIEPQPGIMDIALYVGGESRLKGRDDVLKLSSNENPHGCSPKALAAYQDAATTLHRYPSTDHRALREAIGETYGLDPERIICGAGSDEVLQFVTQSFAGPGDEVISTEHGFSMYPILTKAAGATSVIVPERERRVDVDEILNAVTDRTRIIFLTNPGNPTGTMIAERDIRRMLDELPQHILLVHDGAYTEFADGFDGGAALVDEYENVIATRTFSKIHGLGGLRIGWGYGRKRLLDVLNRVRQPFNLSVVQLATAEAAIRDREFVEYCRAQNAEWREYTRNALLELGIACDMSQTNFLLARFKDEGQASRCDVALREDGIIVRRVTGYGFPEGLRITVGDEAGAKRVISSIKSFMEGEA